MKTSRIARVSPSRRPRARAAARPSPAAARTAGSASESAPSRGEQPEERPRSQRAPLPGRRPHPREARDRRHRRGVGHAGLFHEVPRHERPGDGERHRGRGERRGKEEPRQPIREPASEQSVKQARDADGLPVPDTTCRRCSRRARSREAGWRPRGRRRRTATSRSRRRSATRSARGRSSSVRTDTSCRRGPASGNRSRNRRRGRRRSSAGRRSSRSRRSGRAPSCNCRARPTLKRAPRTNPAERAPFEATMATTGR